MNINDLRYYTNLVETKSFTKTAKIFSVTQPTISISIKRLEEAVGNQLFFRDFSNKDLILTPAGSLLYINANHIINLIDLTKNELSNFNDEKIYLGIPPNIGSKLLPKLLPKLSLFSNNLDFIQGMGSVSLLTLIKDKRISIAIIGVTDKVDIEDVEQIPIMEDDFYLCISKDHHLASKNYIDINDLKEENFVTLDEGHIQYDVFKEWALKNNVSLDSVRYTKETQTALSIILSGIAVGFFVGGVVENRQDIIKIPLKNMPKLYINLFLNRVDELSPYQKLFNEKLVTIIQETDF